ncbi:MAG: HAMP domain-containing histidine kinase [Deltaproteobacteria bacterium]|nr:HAMP domain-containing histidine kinase [Deltaproteobacteria bacterium]
MTFAKKIFIAVFLSTLMVGSILIWAAYKYTVNRSEEDFVARYQVFSKVLADTLNRLDTSTEALMLNAAKVVAEHDEKHGLLSTEKLRTLQSELGITHLFMIDRTGKFTRSTNDDPAGIPNLFSFCENYQKLITGSLDVEATPIIKPNPEPKPFKFLSIPNKDRSRIVEVGVRVDFITKTLAEAIKSDVNVISMSLYAPDGTPFGTYSDQNVAFESKKANLPGSFDMAIASPDSTSFFTKVISSHPRCCQCDVSGTSKNGEYYYVLESKVSKSELKAIQARAGIMFFLIGFGNALLSYILARLLSRRLVRNIEIAVNKVRKIKDQGDVTDRIRMNRGDEISFLTQEFDRLLDSLEESQKKLVEAEKAQSKVELAKIVAHNIRSPVIAIEMMLPGLIMVPERMKRILKKAVSEIKQLSEKLRTQSESVTSYLAKELDTDLVFVPILLDDLVRQKNIEFSNKCKSSIILKSTTGSERLFVKASSLELTCVLSNIINNAFESYGNSGGIVEILVFEDSGYCKIQILDYGSGIPETNLANLGKKNFSLKEGLGRGLGLVHAYNAVESWGGSISVDTKFGVGTKILMAVPIYDSKMVLPKNYSAQEAHSNALL